MRVRFRVAEPNSGSGAPCGASLVGIEASTYDLKVVVDGATIVDVVVPNIGNAVGPIATVNGYTVTNFFYTDPYYAQFDINGLAIHEAVNVEFTVGKTGYHTFTNMFTFYGYDMGNPNSFTFLNPNFEIVLVKNTLAPALSEAFASAVIIPRPLTDQIYVYKNNSSPYTPTYSDSLGNVLFTGANGFFTSNESMTFDDLNINSGGCSTDIPFVHTKWIPTMVVQATHNGCSDSECFTTLTSNQGFAYLDFSNIARVYVNDIQYYGFYGFTVDFSTIDIDGIETNPITQVYEGIIPVYNHDGNANPYVFTTPNVGDFFIQACFTIRTQDDYPAGGATPTGTEPIIVQCCTRLAIQGCNWWSVKETSTCGELQICNKTLQDKTISYSVMNDSGSFDVVDSIDIPACSCVTIVLDTQGVYNFNASHGTSVQAITKSIDCQFRQCMADFIHQIMCKGGKDCKDCDDCNDADYYNFNAFITLSNVYYGIINEYSDVVDFQYVSIDYINTRQADLFKAKQYLERMTAYCSDCVNPCSECN